MTSSCRPSARCGPRNRQTLIFAGARSITAAPRTARGTPRATRRSARTSAGWPSVSSASRARSSRERPLSASDRAIALRRCANACWTSARSSGSGAGRRRSQHDEHAVDVRHRVEDRARDARSTRTSHGQLGEHRRHAIGGRPGPGGEPLADLLLHHRDPARHGRQLLDRAQDRARRDAVGQVRDDLRRGPDRARRGRAASRRRCAAWCSGGRRARRAAPAPASGRARRRGRARNARRGARSARRGRRRSRARRPPGPSSAARSMTPRMFESMRKFWPRSRFGRTPNCLRRRRLGWAEVAHHPNRVAAFAVTCSSSSA